MAKRRLKSKMKMTAYKDNHVSKRKTHMRIITFLIALVVIAGLVFVFPFEFLNAGAEEANETQTTTTTEISEALEASALLSSEIKVTPEGKGLFTVTNFIYLLAAFGGGYIVSGIAIRLAEKRK